MKSKSKDKQIQSIKNRLNRIEGQLRGIQKMYDNDPCDTVELTTQIQAVRAALAGVTILILREEANGCVEKGDTKRLKKIITKTFKTL